MTSGSVAVIVPVLRRPHRVEPLVRSLAAATPEPHRLVFVATSTDVDQLAAIRSAGGELLIEPPHDVGDYAKKINRGLAETVDPFVFTGADDLHFHPGWIPAALAAFSSDRIGVVGTNDLGSPRVIAGDHATHFLVRRTYAERFGTIDEPGKIFHEGYPHEYVDDELIGTARRRGAYAHAGTSHVEHLHPDWGKADTDPLYAAQADRMRAGRRIYRRRRHKWTRR